MAEPALRTASLARRDLARLDGTLGEQPGDDVHDPGRHLERFAGEVHANERVERASLLASGIVEIGARLVGEKHRFGVKGIDQPRSDPHFRFGRFVRVVHDHERATFLHRRKRETVL